MSEPPAAEEASSADGTASTDAVDEALAEWNRQRARRRRRWRWILGVPLGALALYLLARPLPAWMIEKAHKSSIDCVNRIYDSGEGSGLDCERATWWLLYPRLVPWKHAEATQEKVNIELDAAQYAMDLAAVRDLDREARDRAAERMIEIEGGSPPPSDQLFNTFGKLRDAGAYEVLARSFGRAGSDGEREMAIDAAILLGDEKALRAASAAAPLDEPGMDSLEKTGALRCLFGDKRRGVEALARADRVYADAVKDTSPGAKNYEARLAIVACGGTEKEAGFDPTDVGELRRYEVALITGDVGDAHDFRLASPQQRLAALALWVGDRDEEPTEVELHRALELIAPDFGKPVSPSFYSMLTHWSVWTQQPSLGAAIPPPAAALANGSKRLSAWAALAPDRVEQPDYDSDAYFAWEDLRVARWAKTSPRQALEWGAYAMAAQAALEYARRGELEPAARALDRCEALAGARPDAPAAELRPLLASLAAAIKGPEEGLGLLDETVTDAWRKEADPASRALLLQERALLLADLGRFDEAFEDASAAYEASGATDEIPAGFADDLGVLRTSTAWLRAALALRSGHGAKLGDLADGPYRIDINSSPEQVLAYWVRAASAPAEKQAALRWRTHGDSYLATVPLDRVAPALVYLLGGAAGDRDVELWLDVVLSGRHAISGVELMAARAAAARWRGDDRAAAEWDRRVAALRSLAEGDRGQFLLDQL